MHACLLSSADYSAAWIAVPWEWCCSWHRRWRGGRLFEPNCLEVAHSDAAYRVGISESCPVRTVPTPPPGNESAAFSSLAFFLPAAIQVAEKVLSFVGRAFRHDIESAFSSGVLTPEGPDTHVSTTCIAALCAAKPSPVSATTFFETLKGFAAHKAAIQVVET